jgi:diguanylate cyclase (GGDEF)-like protein/PAS domain S-box-containing protein
MNTQGAIRIGPITRISVGLMAMLISLVLVADFVLGVVPSRGQAERTTRLRVAENLAIQITGLLESGEELMVGKTIQQVLSRDSDIRAVSVRRNDGSTVLRRGDTDTLASTALGEASTVNQMRVPILSGKQLWGEVEVRFADNEPSTVMTWLGQPGVQMLVVLGIGGFLLCYAYLRRAMQYLDPSASVPDRVRKAFDTLTEGVVILDQQTRIVLANRAFRELHPEAGGQINGQPIDQLAWLSAGRQGNTDEPAPWVKTLKSSVTVDAEPLAVPQPEGPATQLLVTTAPIADAKGRSRGCLVTFDDVTAVHRANEELRSTLAELQNTRQLIESQNRELSRLATRDSLTGCFNRRAFFEYAQEAFGKANRDGTSICCVMADIDHFKQFNDLYGHAVGDQVIRAVARGLTSGLRQQDILCRYGGEEFCLVMPGATPQEAFDAAERLRLDIEAHAREAIRGTDVVTITASFGVSTRAMGTRSLEEMIEQADIALYKSKQGGRNRVTAFKRATM